MGTLFENAQRIFEVAQAGALSGANAEDFALLIRPDGGLHFVMESPFSIDGAAAYAGAESAFRVTRSRYGVRVQGRSGTADCVLEERSPHRELLRDQPLYRITSPLLISCTATS